MANAGSIFHSNRCLAAVGSPCWGRGTSICLGRGGGTDDDDSVPLDRSLGLTGGQGGARGLSFGVWRSRLVWCQGGGDPGGAAELGERGPCPAESRLRRVNNCPWLGARPLEAGACGCRVRWCSRPHPAPFSVFPPQVAGGDGRTDGRKARGIAAGAVFKLSSCF